METGCRSLHRLKHKAVIALIVVCSLLFYIIIVNIHYNHRAFELIGMLKSLNQEMQHQALHDFFTGKIDEKDGKYILMKNGYHFSGQEYFFIDSYFIVITASYFLIIALLFYFYKRYIIIKTEKLKTELNYLKMGVEHFLFGGEMNRNDQYKECNYLLDRLKQRVYDVNELNENELKKVIKFHQNIVHQINTPLNTIKILVEYLYINKTIDLDYLNNINYAIEKASDLARIYLRTSKLDTGKVSYHFEKIEIFDMIEEVFFSLKIYSDYYHMSLVNRCDGSVVYADAVWIKEAIENIVKNAIENASENKELVVSSKTDNNLTEIWIDSYSNITINIEDISFLRFESSQTGIGIGLHLCKQIIESHLGEVSVTKGPKECIRFIIKLPKQPYKNKIKNGEL